MLYFKKNKIALLTSSGIHFLVIVLIAIENKSSKPDTSMTTVDLVASVPSKKLIKNNSNLTAFQNKNLTQSEKVDDQAFKVKEVKDQKKKNSSQIKQIAKPIKDEKVNSHIKKNNNTSQDTTSNSMSKNVKTSAKYKIGSIKNPHPEYPMIARKKGWQGRLLLNVRVSEKGKVLNINIVKTSGFKILDKTSVETIKEWKFSPARIGNDYVEDYLNIPISFKLVN